METAEGAVAPLVPPGKQSPGIAAGGTGDLRAAADRIGTVMKRAIAQGWRLDDPARNVDQALPKVARRLGTRSTFGGRVWEVPAERMKMKRPHRVPLSSRTVTLLECARSLSHGSGLIFPGTTPGRPLSDMTLSKLVKEPGFDADLHGLRTSFRTWVQEQTSYPGEVAKAALAHLSGDAVEPAWLPVAIGPHGRTNRCLFQVRQ